MEGGPGKARGCRYYIELNLQKLHRENSSVALTFLNQIRCTGI